VGDIAASGLTSASGTDQEEEVGALLANWGFSSTVLLASSDRSGDASGCQEGITDAREKTIEVEWEGVFLTNGARSRVRSVVGLEQDTR
jgi:hypothetical protein